MSVLPRAGFRFWLAAGFALSAVWAQADSVVTNQTATLPRYDLIQCIDRALGKNADILIAKKKLEEAAGSIVEARAGFLPSLTSQGNWQKLETRYATLGGSAPDRRHDIWNVAIRLTENIFAGGADRNRLDMARLNKESRMLDYQANANRIMMEVRIAFYEILRNQANITVHRQAVDFLEQELKTQQQRLEVGTGQRLNVLRAQVSLSLEKAALIESQNQLKNSYVRLSELMAIPYSIQQDQVPFEVEGELAYVKPLPEEGECLARAMALRPELRVRENDVLVQNKQLVVDRSALIPRLDLFVGYDVVSEPNPAQADDYYQGWVAGVSIRWQMFDGMATAGRMRATRARIFEAKLSLDATRRTIQSEVLNAFHDLEQADETIQSQMKNVQLAQESLALTRQSFDLGLSTQLEVLQARLDLTRAQTTELGARFGFNAALARLQRAISSEFKIIDDRATRPASSSPTQSTTNSPPAAKEMPR